VRPAPERLARFDRLSADERARLERACRPGCAARAALEQRRCERGIER
jgi:hypothetical protein